MRGGKHRPSKGEDRSKSARPPAPNSINPGAPFDVARRYAAEMLTAGGERTLHRWQDEFLRWNRAAFDTWSDGDLRAAVYEYLSRQIDPKGNPVVADRGLVNNVVDALRAATKLDDRTEPPAFSIRPNWAVFNPAIDGHRFVSMRNGILDVSKRMLRAATPSFFTRNAPPFDYDAAAPSPGEWLAFLESVRDDDDESVETLQEWRGLCLTLDNSCHKLLTIIGPRRSGKGTIARTPTRLAGPLNTAAPTLSSVGGLFGLQDLIGRQLAIVSDARLGAKTDTATVAENLLRIAGEGYISVRREFKTAYTARLPVRFVLTSNEPPTLPDASGALPSRLIILAMTK